MIMGKINIGFGFACSSFFLAEKKVVELCRREREREQGVVGLRIINLS